MARRSRAPLQALAPEAKAVGARALTPKQERFAVGYVEHGSASRAYREAYEADGMAGASVHREAHAVLRHPKVASRLAELRALVAGAAEITLASHVARLDWICEQAAARGQFSAATAAEIGRAKAAGLLIDWTLLTGTLAVIVSPGPDLSRLTVVELEQLEQLVGKVEHVEQEAQPGPD